MDVFAIYVLKGLLLSPAGNLLLLGLAWFLHTLRLVALTLAVLAGARRRYGIVGLPAQQRTVGRVLVE